MSNEGCCIDTEQNRQPVSTACLNHRGSKRPWLRVFFIPWVMLLGLPVAESADGGQGRRGGDVFHFPGTGLIEITEWAPPVPSSIVQPFSGNITISTRPDPGSDGRLGRLMGVLGGYNGSGGNVFEGFTCNPEFKCRKVDSNKFRCDVPDDGTCTVFGGRLEELDGCYGLAPNVYSEGDGTQLQTALTCNGNDLVDARIATQPPHNVAVSNIETTTGTISSTFNQCTAWEVATTYNNSGGCVDLYTRSPGGNWQDRNLCVPCTSPAVGSFHWDAAIAGTTERARCMPCREPSGDVLFQCHDLDTLNPVFPGSVIDNTPTSSGGFFYQSTDCGADSCCVLSPSDDGTTTCQIGDLWGPTGPWAHCWENSNTPVDRQTCMDRDGGGLFAACDSSSGGLDVSWAQCNSAGCAVFEADYDEGSPYEWINCGTPCDDMDSDGWWVGCDSYPMIGDSDARGRGSNAGGSVSDQATGFAIYTVSLPLLVDNFETGDTRFWD